MRNKKLSVNIDNSDLVNYPNGRIKNNSGAGDGTPVNEFMYGDLHEFKDKLMRLAGIEHNGLPDNEQNSFQSIEALRDFGSKHDVIQTLTTASGVITVSAKLNTIIQNNESLICKAGFNYTTETSIKGGDGTVYSLTVIGNFKTNEYVRLIKKDSGVVLVRLVDSVSADAVISELLFLKKASQAQENAGTLDTVATTPLTNKTVFGLRVNDNTASAPYLASASQNGIYPKEHFKIVENLISPIKNRGWIGGFDIGGTTGSLPVNGDIISATSTISTNGDSFILCAMSNAMANNNYVVKMYVESLGDLGLDNDSFCPAFKVISTTQFTITLTEGSSSVQNIKIHVEIQQL
ncbi:hypothetical protein [Flavobacterium phage FCOV-F18]|nr:hypothetical protein [Flavobacterium phage FCOV-F9]QNJ51386.1 hypothetical protein [Flavobacterium phage FCOV-F8]QNJ51838.1 hypothetical protein [Flavobacterium phage FCOV-F17]QNJ51914.1 hypothetical protein [Flavobacterium phage FCOV-F18]QNJ52294.1 hypothetical protein [Flavobacterium phage FCOV-F23]QNJ52522.1 hypothetical protein [Flavobacterium phage FCOV-F28]QNJ52674.1 hypothetical protein [Flavobacterium phage FCOV-F30]QNJ53814.1 hypothetical protein [Flavobacterium phage FCOV-F48]Q